MLAVNLSTGDLLGDIGRGAVGLMLIMCIVPIYAFVIGCYESEEPHETDAESEGDEGNFK